MVVRRKDRAPRLLPVSGARWMSMLLLWIVDILRNAIPLCHPSFFTGQLWASVGKAEG